jgi:hypothetical protein
MEQKPQRIEVQEQPPELTIFNSLPLPLQTRVLALGGAPLLTCKAAAALADDYQCLLEWYRTKNP